MADAKTKPRRKPLPASVFKLAENAQAVVDFLETYHPYFHDGKSMETDFGGTLADLAASVKSVRKRMTPEQRRQLDNNGV